MLSFSCYCRTFDSYALITGADNKQAVNTKKSALKVLLDFKIVSVEMM
jgi:hypothetical protein